MKTLSNETRNSKSNSYDKIKSFARWVDEYAEVHEMSVDAVLDLALFRLEQEKYVSKETTN